MTQTAKNILFVLFISLFIGVQLFVAFNARRTISLDTRSRAEEITPTPTLSATPSATPTPQGNTVPTCDTLTANPASGIGAPLTVTFTCTGHDPDGYINGATFNFGDRTSDTVEKNVGSPGSITITHTYREVGALGASCNVKDNNGNGVFSPQSEGCKTIVKVAVPTPTPTPTPIATPTPVQTLAPTPTPPPAGGPTAEVTETPIEEATQQSGGFPWWIVGVIGGTIAIVGGFFLLRKKGPPGGGSAYPSYPQTAYQQPVTPPAQNQPTGQAYSPQPPSWPQQS